MFYENFTDEEFIARLRANPMTQVEEALVFRLERALDKKSDGSAVGQFGAHTSDPFPGAFSGKK